MTIVLSFVLMIPCVPVLNATDAGQATMTNNQKNLIEAQALARQFEKEQDPELLRKAYLALENVDLAEESDSAERNQVRSLTLQSWLQLLRVQIGRAHV